MDVNETILEVITLAHGEALKNRVSVQTQLANDLSLFRADRVQLQQVILNLIVNAVEVMSGVSEGSRDLLISSEKDAAGGVLVSRLRAGFRPGIAPRWL